MPDDTEDRERDLESYGRDRIAEGWFFSPAITVSRQLFPPDRSTRLWVTAVLAITLCVAVVVALSVVA